MFELNKNLSRASLEIKRIYETNLNGRIIQPFQSKEIKEEVRNILKEVIVFHDAKFNYTVIKWFNDEEIKYMQDLTKEKYNSFNVQPHEHYSHQIKELRINAFDKPLHQLICTKFFLDMEWILAQIYDIFIEDFDSIHFTRYRVNEIKSNAWHYDNNSNLTCITTLNSDYTGGELSLTNSGVYGDINVLQKISCWAYSHFQRKKNTSR